MTGVAADEDRDGAFVPERVDGRTGPGAGRRGGRTVTVEGTVRAASTARQRRPAGRARARARQRRRHARRRSSTSASRSSSRCRAADGAAALGPVRPQRDARRPGRDGRSRSGDTAADEDLVGAAVDDAIQLAMVVTLTGREAVFAELVRAGPAAAAAARGPRPGGGRRRARADGLDAGLHRRRPRRSSSCAGSGCGSACSPRAPPAAADARAALRGPARPDRDRDQRARVRRLQAGPAARTGWRSSGSGPTRARSRSSPRTGGTWRAPRRAGLRTGWGRRARPRAARRRAGARRRRPRPDRGRGGAGEARLAPGA